MKTGGMEDSILQATGKLNFFLFWLKMKTEVWIANCMTPC